MRRISGATLSGTTRCRYRFRCLEDGDRPACQPIRIVDEGIVVVEPICANCPYFREASEVNLCECPTRADVFERYGV